MDPDAFDFGDVELNIRWAGMGQDYRDTLQQMAETVATHVETIGEDVDAALDAQHERQRRMGIELTEDGWAWHRAIVRALATAIIDGRLARRDSDFARSHARRNIIDMAINRGAEEAERGADHATARDAALAFVSECLALVQRSTGADDEVMAGIAAGMHDEVIAAFDLDD